MTAHTVIIDCGAYGTKSIAFKTLPAAINAANLLSKALNVGWTRAKDGRIWVWADTARNRDNGILAVLTR